jgi:HSP20 family protein
MAFRIFRSSKDEEEKNIEIKNQNQPAEEKDVLEGEGQLMVDVYQTPSEIVIKSAVAGVKPEDIDISIVNDMITIKGKRELDEEVRADDYFYQECYWGSFSRSIILPIEIDADRVTASLKNGILTIRLPKIDKNKVKKIKIKAE